MTCFVRKRLTGGGLTTCLQQKHPCALWGAPWRSSAWRTAGRPEAKFAQTKEPRMLHKRACSSQQGRLSPPAATCCKDVYPGLSPAQAALNGKSLLLWNWNSSCCTKSSLWGHAARCLGTEITFIFCSALWGIWAVWIYVSLCSPSCTLTLQNLPECSQQSPTELNCTTIITWMGRGWSATSNPGWHISHHALGDLSSPSSTFWPVNSSG